MIPTLTPARTLLFDALAQGDVDMANHRLLNLDQSNLDPSGIPPTVHPPANSWLHDWDAVTKEWSYTRPGFSDLRDFLTGAQMQHIDQLGRVRIGTWQADPLTPPFVPTLDQIRSPVADVSLSGNRITNLGAPIDPNDAVTRAFMDFLLQGLNPKEAVRCASTGNVTPATLTRPVDDVTLNSGDRVLLKSQTNPAENGIWVAATGPWARSTDCDSGTEIERAYCAVLEGTINAGTSWVQVLSVTNINTDPKSFLLFSSTPSSNIIAGNGLEKVDNTLNVLGTPDQILVGGTVSIAPTYPGQASITTLGTIGTGIWEATVIDSIYGGTGVNNFSHTITLTDADLQVQKVGLAVPDATLVLNIVGDAIVNVPSTGTLSTLAGMETLTNKRITPRSASIASNAKPAINVDALDVFYITTLAVDIISMSDNLTGTPTDGQELAIWIRDNNSIIVKHIAWGNSFDASPNLPLPVVTDMGQWMFLRFSWHSVKGKFVLVDKVTQIPS